VKGGRMHTRGWTQYPPGHERGMGLRGTLTFRTSENRMGRFPAMFIAMGGFLSSRG